MKTTLLVENNSELENFLALNLLMWVGVDIVVTKSAKFAIEYLNDNPGKVELIVSKSNIISERTIEALMQFTQDSNLDIPIICLGQTKVDLAKNIIKIESALDIKPIIQAAAKSLGVTAQDMVQLNVPEYFAIPIQFFYYITAPITDVYKQDIDDTDQYNLLISEYNDFSSQDIRDLTAKGMTHLYIKKNQRLKFVTNINQEIASKLSHKDLNDNEKVVALEMSQTLLQEKIQRTGITQETITLANKNIKSMSKLAKSSPSLLRLLKRMMKNKSSYQFKHSQLLMYVGAHLMSNLDWGNEEQIQKFQFIAFFHDIALENDEQAKIHSEEHLRNSNLEPLKKELVKNHAQIAATLISTYPKAPMGSEMIIKQHHGISHGVGFSEHYGANLSPITIVFVLAEDFVDNIISTGDSFDIDKKISEMREKFPTQRFQKIINVLDSIVLK